MKLNITPAGNSDSTITTQDEGTPLSSTVTTLNFTGAGVTASGAGATTTVNIPGGSGAGATGTAILNFGAFPGTSDTSVAVTGQASILSGSIVNAWIRPVATADHTADEHMLETIKIFAGNIVASTGFTIYGFNSSEINENLAAWLNVRDTAGTTGRGTRIYGQWTIAWKWE